MKYTFAFFMVCLAMTVFAARANAGICARGVYHAGCAGPNGAVVVRPPTGVAPVRPHCAWVNGMSACR